jgi:cell division septum initiation protein DivIVA
MYRRAEVMTDGGVGGRPAAGEEPGADNPGVPPAFRRPDVDAGLDQLLDRRPMFRRRHRGYDRFQVDNYVAWAEAELDAARRQCDYLLSRYGACAAQLEMVRRMPRRSMTGPVSARLGEMLRLASEEAEGITAAGIDEAERIVTGARVEAEARLRKVGGIREAALAAGEELRAQARRDAEQLLRTAAAQRDAAAAEAAAELSAVRAEVDDLRRQRDEARRSLQRLTAQIGQALQAVATGVPEELAVLAERHPVASSVS